LDHNIFCHERLSINGIHSGAQPLINVTGDVVLVVNGEIYNHRWLRENKLTQTHVWQTDSDCEIILHLYEEHGAACLPWLEGMFAFTLYDQKSDRYIIARDPLGLVCLYQGWRSRDQTCWVASEMKALHADCDQIISFPPGHYYDSKTKECVSYFNPIWWNETWIPENQDNVNYALIRDNLHKAVEKRLMAEVPFGVLLSGGLDSSLIASIVCRLVQRTKRGMTNGNSLAGEISGQDLPTFSIGLKGSPDLLAAQKVASFLGTHHYSFEFTLDEGFDALSDVIYHLETYDVTTIRASIPMYLLSRKIKALGIKMVLSGEGSDELLGGYLYFHHAPSAQEFHVECVRRLKSLHAADCLRANKSTMAWGVEARVPFLDVPWLNSMMTLDPKFKQCGAPHPIEKYILRKAFDTPDDPYLPDDILWRQKEQFSDGVGYSWIDTLKAQSSQKVSDAEWAQRETRFSHDPPTTREAYYYRSLFESHFPSLACAQTVIRWVPRKDWGCDEDPSGRAQKGHAQSLESQSARLN
jgi:asparagine synthase (glutamine-hydrolysing)